MLCRRVHWLRLAALHAAPPRATAGRPRRRRKPLAAPPAMALCHGSARAGLTGGCPFVHLMKLVGCIAIQGKILKIQN